MGEVVAALGRGELVAIPTETVYGLAADAGNGRAVARIFAAKGRPRFNPLICHVDGVVMAEAHVVLDRRARRLAERFWPGPLTLVLERSATSTVHPLAAAGLPTLAVRAPRGPARAVITAFGHPLAAPSANRSGRITATTAAEVVEQLGDAVALVIDGGPSQVGLESTIVGLADGPPRLLRPGGLPAEEIEAVLGEPLLRAGPGAAVTAPGMLKSHYAPHAAMRLEAREVRPGEALLAFGPDLPPGAARAAAIRNLSPRGDLVEAAAALFSAMAELDRSGARTIAAMPVPRHGLGEAINDRLARAAAPRPGGNPGEHPGEGPQPDAGRDPMRD
ncbi:threonylcarbamoyl-AMP synthase [Rhizobiales bacterium L72]|uniref:Threonylcarbamoyl-AMP synthase n=2 Tax=Propylenella binzhouense TaxID=2555902 RepID=A0A964WU99_9HYPH|nr:L-threonylcarbamoyladenylate synthase [Propylenella binzhouense]MYZ48814.1 threonylcarbamoyl-AMP synthase [Propylenella binzhouense]